MVTEKLQLPGCTALFLFFPHKSRSFTWIFISFLAPSSSFLLRSPPPPPPSMEPQVVKSNVVLMLDFGSWYTHLICDKTSNSKPGDSPLLKLFRKSSAICIAHGRRKQLQWLHQKLPYNLGGGRSIDGGGQGESHSSILPDFVLFGCAIAWV